MILSNIIEALLLRNLQEVFGEGDPERRRSAIEQLYTEDCVVNLSVGQYHGHDALDRISGELRASHPSYVYTPHNAPIAVQDGGRIDWGSGPAGEPPRYTGIDIIITRDSKIQPFTSSSIPRRSEAGSQRASQPSMSQGSAILLSTWSNGRWRTRRRWPE